MVAKAASVSVFRSGTESQITFRPGRAADGFG